MFTLTMTRVYEEARLVSDRLIELGVSNQVSPRSVMITDKFVQYYCINILDETGIDENMKHREKVRELEDRLVEMGVNLRWLYSGSDEDLVLDKEADV